MDVLEWPLPAGGSGSAANPYTSKSGTGGIQEAINDLPAVGGKVVVPAGYYSITSPINPKGKAVIIEGQGWQTNVAAGFGDAQWANLSNTIGSVLVVSGTADALDFSGSQSSFFLRDLAIIGPGSGSSVGVNFDCTSFSRGGADNVLVANFLTGWNLSNLVSNSFGYVSALGCSTGYLLQNTCNDVDIWRLEAEACGVAVNIAQAIGLSIHNGLVQSNTNGILIAPASTAVYDITLHGIWFENNTNYGIKFDTAHAAITDLLLSGCHAGTAGDAITFGTLSNTLAAFTLVANDFRTFDIAAQSSWSQWLFENTRFSTFNSGRSIYVYNGTTLTSVA